VTPFLDTGGCGSIYVVVCADVSEDGLWLEAEELSAGEIRSGPDIQLPIPVVKTSLQMIADMYTDD